MFIQNRFLKRLLTLVACLLTFQLMAQEIDPNFKAKILKTGNVLAMQVQPDGKILIGGDFIFYNGKRVNPLIRLHPDGQIDTTFQTDCPVIGTVSTIKLLPDGKMLVYGGVSNCYNEEAGPLVRLFPDGKVDPDFKVSSDMYLASLALSQAEVSVQTDGKIIYVGGPQLSEGFNGLHRLNIDGSPDSTFQIPIPEIILYNHLLLKDGSIIACGGWWEFLDTEPKIAIKYSTDGIVDSSFSFIPNQKSTDLYNETMQLGLHVIERGDGQISVLGNARRGGTIILDFDEEGEIKIQGRPTLNGGILTSNILALPNNNYMFAVQGSYYRLGENGSRIQNLSDGNIRQIRKDSSARLIIGGEFIQFNAKKVNSLIATKYDEYLTTYSSILDTTFSVNTLFHKVGIVKAVTALENGKIMVGGNFDQIGNTRRFHIARLHSDGTIDTAFSDEGIHFDRPVEDILSLSSGKILVSGKYENDPRFTFQDPRMNGITRLNENGSLDSTFQTNVPFNPLNGRVEEISLAADGKIYLNKSFPITGYYPNRNARIFADGLLDTTYFDKINFVETDIQVEVAATTNGKTLIGAKDFSIDSQSNLQLVRLLPNDEIDPTFTPLQGLGTSFNARLAIRDIKELPNGKILVAGNFDSLNGEIIPDALLRLNPDGTIDSTFQMSTSEARSEFFPPTIYDVFPLPNNDLLLRGAFKTLGGKSPESVTVLSENGQVKSAGFSFTAGGVIDVASKADGTVFLAGEMYHPLNLDNVGLVKVTYPTENMLLTYALSGTVTNLNGEPLAETVIQFIDQDTTATLTDENGVYQFQQVAAQKDYQLKPFNNESNISNVSTFDLLLTQQHILNIQPFVSPYQHVAADVNKSGHITVLDILLMQKVILGIDDQFSQNTTWQFLPADYILNENDPIIEGFPNQITIDALNQNYTNLDFIGIQTGDVSGSTSALQNSESRNSAALSILVENPYLQKDKTYKIRLDFADKALIEGFQYTLNTRDLAVLKINNTAIEGGFGTKGGLAWNYIADESLSLSQLGQNQSLLLTIQAEKSGQLSDFLTLNRHLLKPEAYTTDPSIFDLNLLFGTTPTTDFQLFQNHPNPFQTQTMVRFALPKAENIQLRIFDLNGRTVWQQTGSFSKGVHEIPVRINELTGLLFYELSAGEGTLRKKMLVLD